MHYVYVLQSKPSTDSVRGKFKGQIYVGSTNNLKSRFKQHNEGKVVSTKRYKPWKLLYYEAYELEELTRMREKRLKYNGNAMRELKKRIGFSKINSLINPAPSRCWMKFSKSGAGFTLIEILITIALIGVMAVGIITFLNPLAQIQKANDAKRKGDISQIQKAVETYYNDFGQYPAADTSSSNYRIKADATTTLDWGSTGWQYVGTLPKDPSSSQNYTYCSPSGGQSYYLYASLERGANDPQVCNGGSVCANFSANCPTASCGTGAVCNYGVSSPNVSP